MRARLNHLVTSALQHGSAVPAFTCYDFTTALAVVGAAEEAGRGVILLVAPKTAATANGLRLIAALRGLADAAGVPVVVQLDHASDLEVMADAVTAGADSVLADGSSLPYEDNIALVVAARAWLGPDVVLEAELGGLAGDEDRAFGADQSGVSVAGRAGGGLCVPHRRGTAGRGGGQRPRQVLRASPSCAGTCCRTSRCGPTFPWCCTEPPASPRRNW